MTHRIEGKITYIHGAEPINLLALSDPTLQRQPKPIPVIAIGDAPVTIEVYYGGPADGGMRPAEPDEFDVWIDPPKTGTTVRWKRVFFVLAILTLCAGAYILAFRLLAQIPAILLS